MQAAGTGGLFSDGAIVARFFAIADNATVRRKTGGYALPLDATCEQEGRCSSILGHTLACSKDAHVS